MRIKPSTAQSSTSTEQGEPPTKKLKQGNDTAELHEPAASSEPAAAAQPAASQPAPVLAQPKPSLTALLGDKSNAISCACYAHVGVRSAPCVFLWPNILTSEVCWYRATYAAAGNYASDSDEGGSGQDDDAEEDPG